MKNINFHHGVSNPDNKSHFLSFIFNSIKTYKISFEQGHLSISQIIFYIQWARSVFNALNVLPGLLFTEKYLLRYRAIQAREQRDAVKGEELAITARAFVEKAKQAGLYKPSHSKTLATSYWQLGLTYAGIGEYQNARDAFDDAERILFIALSEYPDYSSGTDLLVKIQASASQLPSIG